MATTIITKNGSGAPLDGDLSEGELAVDLTNKQLYTKNSSGVIKLGGSGNSGEWEVNGDDIYYDTGNVGVGTSLPQTSLHLQQTSDSSSDGFRLTRSNGLASFTQWVSGAVWNLGYANPATDDPASPSLSVNAAGNVGIGTDEPAHLLEITSNGTALNDRSVRIGSDRAKNVIGFGSSSGSGANLPNVGVDGTDFVVDNGGITRLTIDATGNATFSGKVITNNIGSEANACGIRFSGATDTTSKRVLPTDTSGVKSAEIDLGSSGGQFKDGWFSGMVNAGYSTMDNGVFYNNYTGSTGVSFSSVGMEPTDSTGTLNTGTNDIGSITSKWKDAHLSGNVAVGGNVDCANIYASGVIGSSQYPIASGYFTGPLRSGSLVLDSQNFYRVSTGAGGIKFTTIETLLPTDNTGTNSNGALSLGANVNRFKNGWFSGTVTSGSGLLMSSRDLIQTLSTLRDATKDETTLEGLRDAIGNAVGGLIEKFEAMQSEVSTQDS